MAKSREIGWSLTRANMFADCRRRFYFQYVFSEPPSSSDTAARIYEMKKVIGLEMWVGQVVHSSIEWALSKALEGSIPTAAEVEKDVVRRLSEGWKASKNELWRSNPRDDDFPCLFEHYYGLPVNKESTDGLKEKALLCARNFMGSEVFGRIVELPADSWLPIERYSTFRVDGILFFAKLDFAFRHEGLLWVYDWKSGKPSEGDRRQLVCYGLYAAGKWDVPPEDLRLCAAYLQPVFDVVCESVGEDDFVGIRGFVRQGYDEMLGCYRDPGRGLAAIDDFSLTDVLWGCKRCGFRGVCEGAERDEGRSEI